jgi:L-asparagine transporter-like permease
VAIVVQSAITLAFALTGTFERLAILANVSVLALYLGCALAAWQLRRLGIEGGGTGTAFRVPLAGVTPWLACAVIAWLLTGLTATEWFGFAVCVTVASLPYFIARRKS